MPAQNIDERDNISRMWLPYSLCLVCAKNFRDSERKERIIETEFSSSQESNCGGTTHSYMIVGSESTTGEKY